MNFPHKTNQTYQVLLILSLILLVSCSPKSTKTKLSLAELLELFPEKGNLKPQVFYDDTNVLIEPWEFKSFGNTMIILDEDSSNLATLLDLKSKTKISRLLRIGKGPNEFIRPELLKLNKDTLIVFDSFKKEISIFLVSNIIKGLNTPIDVKKLTLKHKDDHCFYLRKFNEQLVAVGIFADARYQVINTEGNYLYDFGSYPEIKSKIEYNNKHLGFVFGAKGDICVNEEGNKVMAMHNTCLEIFSKDKRTQKCEIEKAYYWSTPKIESEQYIHNLLRVNHLGKEDYIGMSSLVPTSKYIYTALSMYTFGDYMQGITDEYDYILVFDWDGNPISSFKLSSPISYQLELSKDGTSLLSMQVDPEKGYRRIVSIPIPEKFLN